MVADSGRADVAACGRRGVYVMAIPVAAVHNPCSPLAEDAPPGWTDVAFDTSDGVTLRGWFTPHATAPVIVVGSNRTGADPQARELVDRRVRGARLRSPRTWREWRARDVRLGPGTS